MADRRLKRAQQLGEQNFARWQICQLLDLVAIEDAPFDETAHHLELQPRGADELVDEPWREAEVVIPERDRDRALELRLEGLVAGSVRCASRQRVLHHAVLD